MNKVRVQDDLYEYVNGEWLEKAEIPADRPTAGGFAELDQNVEKILMGDFKDFAEGKKKSDIKEMAYAINLYKKFIDEKRRNEEGIKPVLSLLEEIKNLKDCAELNAKAFDLALSNVDLPFNFGVEADMKDATKHSFIMLGPSLILPDTTYYDEANPAGKQLLGIWANMAQNALKETPLSEQEQAKFLEDALAFDALISKRVKSQLEWADYTKNYNPFSLDEVASFVKPLDLKQILKQIYPDLEIKEVVLYDPRAIKEANLYFNEETFELYKHWAYIRALLGASKYLSLNLASNAGLYRRMLLGIAAEPVLEKQAYQFVSQIFSEPIGVYYGRTYFGEEAKKDVVSLVKKIIETYKTRVKNNPLLEDKTKEKAILKLSTIEIKMGYPDEIRKIYGELEVNEEDCLYDACNKIMKKRILNELAKLGKKVDRTEWLMPGHMVNACYNPSANDITFPAAILQKPFYALSQSISANLGGIGAVIGHEISHAFDNNGAQFDENGNLCNWWTEKDYQAFQESTKKMIEEFDGIPFHGGKVNGQLVVSENIADNGGMAVTIEIMHNTIGADFKEYFMNWARVWCLKAKEEYILYLLSNDVHSPTKLRANIQPRNFQEWYQAFDVTEKDEMYIAPEKRVLVW